MPAATSDCKGYRGSKGVMGHYQIYNYMPIKTCRMTRPNMDPLLRNITKNGPGHTKSEWSLPKNGYVDLSRLLGNVWRLANMAVEGRGYLGIGEYYQNRNLLFCSFELFVVPFPPIGRGAKRLTARQHLARVAEWLKG